MSDLELFDRFEKASRDVGAQAALDRLVSELHEQKRYQLIFELRLLQKRAELGMPLVFSGTLADVPEAKRDDYQAALVEAAREAGNSFLAEGDIERAWTYFRAIGEPGPVAAAIERVQSADEANRVLAIALLEDVNPRKGYELLLEHRGLCQATDFLIKSTDRDKRVMFLQMLVRAFYAQLVANLKEAIHAVEGANPSSDRVVDLIAGRDWLFDGGRLYIENSHLLSILHASPDIPDRETMTLVLELAEYAQKLDPMHRVEGEPPFDDPFVDHAEYLRVMLGEEVDRALAHFRAKLSHSEPATADVLVALLTHAGRFDEAIAVSTEYLRGEAGERALSATQLCQMAGDYSRLREVSREGNDLVGFAAAILRGIFVMALFVPIVNVIGQAQKPSLTAAGIHASVALDAGDLFTYRYTLENGPSSAAGISRMSIDISLPAGAAKPSAAGLVNRTGYFIDSTAAARTIKISQAIPVGLTAPQPGWRTTAGPDATARWVAATDANLIKPRQRLGGFVLTSHAPPALRRYVLVPHVDPEKAPVMAAGEDPGEQDRYRQELEQYVESQSISGITLGPGSLGSMTADGALASLASQLPQARSLRWISSDAAQRSLNDKLQAARAAISKRQIDSATNLLKALRAEVAAPSGKGLTSDAVTLVDLSLQYTLRLLAKP